MINHKQVEGKRVYIKLKTIIGNIYFLHIIPNHVHDLIQSIYHKNG